MGRLSISYFRKCRKLHTAEFDSSSYDNSKNKMNGKIQKCCGMKRHVNTALSEKGTTFGASNQPLAATSGEKKHEEAHTKNKWLK